MNLRPALVAAAAVAALAVSACAKHNDQAANDTTSASTAAPGSADASGAASPASAPTAATPAPGGAVAAPEFVTKAAASDMFEITEAHIALKRSKSADVKKFADMMIRDHTKSTQNLKAAIATSGQTLPLPSALPSDLQSKVDDLNRASASDFDKMYVNQQVDAHQNALGMLQGYANNGNTPALKQFASSTAPTVQMHLAAAQKLQAGMSGAPGM